MRRQRIRRVPGTGPKRAFRASRPGEAAGPDVANGHIFIGILHPAARRVDGAEGREAGESSLARHRYQLATLR